MSLTNSDTTIELVIKNLRPDSMTTVAEIADMFGTIDPTDELEDHIRAVCMSAWHLHYIMEGFGPGHSYYGIQQALKRFLDEPGLKFFMPK